MIFLILFLICVVIAVPLTIICIIKRYDECDLLTWVNVIIIVIGIMFFGILGFKIPISYVDQLHDIASFNVIDEEISIYEKRSNELLPVFTKYLAELYPEYEKEIFNKISPNDIDIYLVKYPELKNIEAVKLLVEKINLLEMKYIKKN